ncbi:MAG: superoxide dismutase family protein [Variibacter sp.]|nr:superoxide dismutase family protein [Variibacter sp.]
MNRGRCSTAGAWLVAAAVLCAAPAAAQTAKATLKDKDGKEVGTLTLVETPSGVLLALAVKGLPPGEHAFHIHAVGLCEPPSFTSAQGHFNPGTRKHGFMAAEGAHAGDMPNLHVPASGEVRIEVLNQAVTLRKGAPNSLFDADGSAVVIHAAADDYRSDPAGQAGDRIACGVIQ